MKKNLVQFAKARAKRPPLRSWEKGPLDQPEDDHKLDEVDHEGPPPGLAAQMKVERLVKEAQAGLRGALRSKESESIRRAQIKFENAREAARRLKEKQDTREDGRYRDPESIQTGAKGGRYYVSASGTKVYLK